MISIVFETHSTSIDNEAYRASGHFDSDLSPLGIEQAKQLGRRYEDVKFDVIFCSDLKRSYNTATIAFKGCLIIRDSRLRECNYGDMTHTLGENIKNEKLKRISEPFPNGESYNQVINRMKIFLKELFRNYNDKHLIIIGHRGTWYSLEHLLNKRPLKEVIMSEWKWQPGWTYGFKEEL